MTIQRMEWLIHNWRNRILRVKSAKLYFSAGYWYQLKATTHLYSQASPHKLWYVIETHICMVLPTRNSWQLMWLMISTYLIIQPLKQNNRACKFINKVDWWSLIVSTFISWNDIVEEVIINSYQGWVEYPFPKQKWWDTFLPTRLSI
jgi:hypothetical protein